MFSGDEIGLCANYDLMFWSLSFLLFKFAYFPESHDKRLIFHTRARPVFTCRRPWRPCVFYRDWFFR
jgi:hypothetical protein